jgi:polyphosphate kinase
VEVAVPVLDAECRRRLDLILSRELADASGWELHPDGSYSQQQSLPVGDPATAQGRTASSRGPTEEEAVWTG